MLRLFCLFLTTATCATASNWGIQVYNEKGNQMKTLPDEDILADRVIPGTIIQILTGGGAWADLPTTQQDREDAEFDTQLKHIVRVSVTGDSQQSPIDVVCMSKVRVTLSSKNDDNIAEYSIRMEHMGESVPPSGPGLWVFSPPKCIDQFFIYFKLAEAQQIIHFLDKIEVMEPATYTTSLQVVELPADSLEEAISQCRKYRSWVSTSAGITRKWIGILESEQGGARHDDGSYVTSPPQRDTCHAFSSAQTCTQTTCSLPSVEYYTVPYNSGPGRRLTDMCWSGGRGVPVLPSSDLELELVSELFPGVELVVGVCDGASREWEDVVARREGDDYECSELGSVVILSEGKLSNWGGGNSPSALHSQQSLTSVPMSSMDSSEVGGVSNNLNGTYTAGVDEDRSADMQVSCKRLPEINKRDDIVISATNINNKEGLFDNNLDVVVSTEVDIAYFIIPAYSDTAELRMFTQYKEENANSFAYVKIEKTCRCEVMLTTSLEPMHVLLDLSSRTWHRITDAKAMECPADMTDPSRSLIVRWPNVVPVTEIQVIREVTKLHVSVSGALKVGHTVEISCTVVGSESSEVEWLCTGGQSYCKVNTAVSYRTIDTVSKTLSWVSVLSVREIGLYTCKVGWNEVSANVAMAKTCNTDELGDFHHAHITHDPAIRMGARVRVECDETYTLVGRITCQEGGTFLVEGLEEGGKLCVGQMEQLATEIQGCLDEGDEEGAAEMLLQHVGQHNFTTQLDVEAAVTLLERICTQGMDQIGVLSTVVKTVDKLSGKRLNGSLPTIAQVEAALRVIDMIGSQVTGSLKLGTDKLALVVEDMIDPDTDVTFAMYNDTALDNLKLYTWTVDIGLTADTMTLPASYTKGRVWFTVFQRETIPSGDVASFILGANIRDMMPVDEEQGDDSPPFSATITLRKLYYGVPRSASCVFWDTRSAVWSREGVEKVSESATHVTCRTSHLTSFAVLMTRDDSYIPVIHTHVLNFLSMAGCALSSLCLIFTLVGLLRFHHIRTSSQSVVRTNFSLALLGALILFLTMIEQTGHYPTCLGVAVSLHYLFLVSVFWMLCETVHVYLNTKCVVVTGHNHVVLMVVFAWCCPLLIVAFTVLTTEQPFAAYVGEDLCWLKDTAMIYWFAAPTILIALINIALYIAILNQFVKNVRARKPNTSVSGFRSCLLLLIVFGCTWVLGVFTLFIRTTLFQYLFAMTNSVQGFCIFYCYCLSDPQVLLAWKSGGKSVELLKNKEVTVESTVSVSTRGQGKDEDCHTRSRPTRRKATTVIAVTSPRATPAAAGDENMMSRESTTESTIVYTCSTPDTVAVSPVLQWRETTRHESVVANMNWYENDVEDNF